MYFLSQNKYSEIGIGRIRAIPETPVAFNRNLFPRTQTSEACPQQVTSMFPGKPTTMYRITMFHIERMARASGRQIQTPQVTWTRANCITGLSKISATWRNRQRVKIKIKTQSSNPQHRHRVSVTIIRKIQRWTGNRTTFRQTWTGRIRGNIQASINRAWCLLTPLSVGTGY